MLTKSLHTITAATNVARFLLGRADHNEYVGAHIALAYKALEILGHGPGSDVSDPTWTKIVANCKALLQERAQ